MTETKHRERSNNKKKKCWLTKKIPDSSLKVQSFRAYLETIFKALKVMKLGADTISLIVIHSRQMA